MKAEEKVRSVSPEWHGSLALGAGLAAYIGSGTSAASHRHSAVQLVHSQGAPLLLRVAGHDFEAQTAIVPADVEHSFVARQGELLLMLVEPSGTFGKALNEFAHSCVGADVTDKFGDLSTPPLDPEALIGWSRTILSEAVGTADWQVDCGHRTEVSNAVRFVTSTLDSVPRLTDVAAQVGLSPRQLSRSFTLQVGMPFRRFVVWSRIRRAVLAVQDGNDLTNAAAAAGFADSAHFSRVFLQLFGLQPSLVLPFVGVAEAEARH